MKIQRAHFRLQLSDVYCTAPFLLGWRPKKRIALWSVGCVASCPFAVLWLNLLNVIHFHLSRGKGARGRQPSGWTPKCALRRGQSRERFTLECRGKGGCGGRQSLGSVRCRAHTAFSRSGMLGRTVRTTGFAVKGTEQSYCGVSFCSLWVGIIQPGRNFCLSC